MEAEYAVVFRDVTYRYPGSSEPAVKNISFSIRRGEFVVITGPSGGGKSTICRIMNGLIPHFYKGELKGKVIVDGIDVARSSVRELAKRVGLVFQNPESQIVNITVEEEVAFGLENMMYPPEVIRERVDWALSLLGIEHLRDRMTYTLSGGELQKVALASVIALKPRILVLDEPTANMDPYSAREFLGVVEDLWRETGMTVVLVEHRLSEVLHRASRLIVVNREVLADGRPRDVVNEGLLEALGIDEPPVARLARRLGMNPAPLTVDEAVGVVRRWLGG